MYQAGFVGEGATTAALALASKKRGEARRRGRQAIKPRGMVGLQRPQYEVGMEPEVKDEEDNKLICISMTDDFVLKQDLCVMCGSLGNDLEGRLISCTQVVHILVTTSATSSCLVTLFSIGDIWKTNSSKNSSFTTSSFKTYP